MIEQSLEQFIDLVNCGFISDYFTDKEKRDMANKKYDNDICVRYADDFNGWSSTARRPYFRLRGKSVTKEQAFDIIRRTDRTFEGLVDKNCDYIYLQDYVDVYHLQNRWWIDNISPRFMSWCKPDGTIGYNDIMGKYPDLEEPLVDLFNLLKAFPYLDFVWAITCWDELPLDVWERFRNDKQSAVKSYKSENYEGFEESIDILFWVHDKKVEILQGQGAINKYCEYNSKYGQCQESFTASYWEDKWKETGDLPVSLKYLDKCLDVYGLKRDELKFLYSIVEV